MSADDSMNFLDEEGDRRFGLCMFVPAIMSPAANRLLNAAYGDSGDNLSVPMCHVGSGKQVRFLAGNYSSADLISAKKTIDVLEKIPGAVMLVTEAGVGASTANTLALLENGRTKRFTNHTHSFFSFAVEHLMAERAEHPSDTIEEFSDFGITIQAQILTPDTPAQSLIRTPWEAIFQEISRDPNSLFRFKDDPRAFEEFIADTYRLDGYDVQLTPRSNDGGVDVIASKGGFGAIKIFDQAKAYSMGRRVSANDVRAAYGVLLMARDVSKVIVTTTSNFAPGVYKEFAEFKPRVELRHGQNLIDWLKHVEANLHR